MTCRFIHFVLGKGGWFTEYEWINFLPNGGNKSSPTLAYHILIIGLIRLFRLLLTVLKGKEFSLINPVNTIML
jgi:hypothetical protein